MTNSSLDKRLEKLKEKIECDDFLHERGLGNEISFYIFDYEPSSELLVRKYIRHIVQNSNMSGSGVKILECDLYKLFIHILKEQNDFDTIISLEEREGKEYILQALTPFITPEWYSQKIEEMANGYDILFITGVGKVYPFMRAHNILNNLQQYIKGKPVIMFYPGEFSGQDLMLFNKFKDDNYYRAFPIN